MLRRYLPMIFYLVRDIVAQNSFVSQNLDPAFSNGEELTDFPVHNKNVFGQGDSLPKFSHESKLNTQTQDKNASPVPQLDQAANEYRLPILDIGDMLIKDLRSISETGHQPTVMPAIFPSVDESFKTQTISQQSNVMDERVQTDTSNKSIYDLTLVLLGSLLTLVIVVAVLMVVVIRRRSLSGLYSRSKLQKLPDSEPFDNHPPRSTIRVYLKKKKIHDTDLEMSESNPMLIPKVVV